MLLVGLTGGIGSGKSTVARMLAARGAVVFDADELARRAVDPGTPGQAAVVQRFGSGLLTPDGGIDREELARRVFRDDQARHDLEAIVHPEVFRLLAEGLVPFRETDRVAVFDAPLIVEAGFDDAFDVLVVVTAPVDARVSRIVAQGRMSEQETRARIGTQASDEEKERVADFVIRNDGDLEELEHLVSALWDQLEARVRGEGSPTLP
jgi:dephospho-CoA kinase